MEFGIGKAVANLDFEEERTDGQTAATPQLINEFAAIFLNFFLQNQRTKEKKKMQVDFGTEDGEMAEQSIMGKRKRGFILFYLFLGIFANPNVDFDWVRSGRFFYIIGPRITQFIHFDINVEYYVDGFRLLWDSVVEIWL